MPVRQEALEVQELEQTLDRLAATQIMQQPILLVYPAVGGTPEIMVRLARQVMQGLQEIPEMLATQEIQEQSQMRQLVPVGLGVLVELVDQLLLS